jgi:hypothetical protein
MSGIDWRSGEVLKKTLVIGALLGLGIAVAQDCDIGDHPLVIVVLVAGAVFLIYGAMTACPSCKVWFKRELTAKTEFGRRSGFETVNRHDVIRNNEGREIARIARKEQVHATYISYLVSYKCRSCNHSWAIPSESRVEG